MIRGRGVAQGARTERIDARHTPGLWDTIRLAVEATTSSGPAFTHQALGRHIDSHGLAGYWCDLTHKAEAATRWGDGFPRYRAHGALEDDVISVAQAALGYWEMMLEGRPMAEQFLRLADWLMATAEAAPAGGIVWRTNIALGKYNLAPGWASALGQGEAISVLLRAASITDNAGYGEAARAAFEPLTVPVADGGLQRRIDGALVLEEYPTVRSCAILNGWILALLGVHELATVTGDERVRHLRDESAAGVVALLPRYDVGWWSCYSLYSHGRTDLAKPFYHRFHVVLLDALSLVWPDPLLPTTARRWERQLTPTTIARVAADKVVFRVHRLLHERSHAAARDGRG